MINSIFEVPFLLFFFNFIAVVSVRTHLEEKYLTNEKQRMSLLCFCLGKAFREKVT